MEKNTRNTIVISAVVAIVTSLLTFYATQDILLAPSLRATEQIRENYASSDGTVSQINANACNRDGVCEVNDLNVDKNIAVGNYAKEIIKEGESTTIYLDGFSYTVSIQSIDPATVVLRINGVDTSDLGENEAQTLEGNRVAVRIVNILYNAKPNGLSAVEFDLESVGPYFVAIGEDYFRVPFLAKGSSAYICSDSTGFLYGSNSPCV